MPIGIDRHHLLNTEKDWDLRPESAVLRNNPMLIARIGRLAHNMNHAANPAVPVPSYHILKRAAIDFRPADDVLGSMDNLMLVLDMAAKHPRAHSVERDLAQLTIRAIELQRPFVILGFEQAREIDSRNKRVLVE
jgi:hypothetical protein